MLRLLTLALPFAPAEALGPGEHTRTLASGGLERTYLVHVPRSYDGKRPYPVVLVFHGGGSNARQWIPFCGLDGKADRAGFIAVYPNGTGKVIQGYEVLGWNGGPRRPGGDGPEANKVDDVGFTGALL